MTGFSPVEKDQFLKETIKQVFVFTGFAVYTGNKINNFNGNSTSVKKHMSKGHM